FAFRKNIVALYAALFTLSSLGAPMMVYRCSMSGECLIAKSCCAKTPARETHSGSIANPACATPVAFGIPLKANVIPNSSRIFATQFISQAFFPEEAIAPTVSTVHCGQTSKEYLPPPLLLTQILLV
ncbi:MAG TPA: hypothetical protein VFA55_00390, partial [Candidatus Kapabacteria bacterium]|nr:hypothetical protein [Candidatus Kapabacteria bacterium]